MKKTLFYNKAIDLFERLHNDKLVANISISFGNITNKYKFMPNINIYEELSEEQKETMLLKKIVNQINKEYNKELVNIADDFDYFKFQK